jgi:hypothetical protein
MTAGERLSLILIGWLFAMAFCLVVIPALFNEPGEMLSGGFSNPYAAGYAFDTIACWAILAVLVHSERRPWGWLALVFGLVPGVAVGLVVHLLWERSS